MTCHLPDQTFALAKVLKQQNWYDMSLTEGMQSVIQLKKDANQLYLAKEWQQAEHLYLELIKHPKHADMVAIQNSFRERVFRCRVRLERYKEAGDILAEMCDQIIYHESDLFKWVIPKYLKQVYLCYLLAGLKDKGEHILQRFKLSDSQRLEILSQEISAQTLLF